MKPKYRRMLLGMKAGKDQPDPDAAAPWHLYILRCGDGSLYTGVTMDVERRVSEHREGKAARYTRAHRPVELVHSEECGDRSGALKRECAVKSMSRKAKEALIQRGPAKAVDRRRTR